MYGVSFDSNDKGLLYPGLAQITHFCSNSVSFCLMDGFVFLCCSALDSIFLCCVFFLGILDYITSHKANLQSYPKVNSREAPPAVDIRLAPLNVQGLDSSFNNITQIAIMPTTVSHL
jgi:hypothetical protein